MTGDDHGGNGTAGRFDDLREPESRRVRCGRVAVRPGDQLRLSGCLAHRCPGRRVPKRGLRGRSASQHRLRNPWTEASLRTVFSTQLAALATDRPSLLAPATSRTHCIAWSDWATQPKVEHDYGIRLDTNYYYWPGSWMADRPGVFTGSGFPMRFADTDGTMIDVYQAPTQMTDESGQSYPSTANTLLDRALGAEGYYGTFVANIHTDSATPQANTDIVNAALARGVPVISAKQLLTWLDGRNSSSFQNLAFNGSDLTFTMAVGAGTDGLQAMLPITGGTGSLTSLRRGGSPVTFTQRDVKGVTYAVFDAAPGAYTATYTADTTPPVISAVTVTPKSTSATIAWTTDEPATSQVQFGTDAGTLSQGASSPGLTRSHSVSLAGLAPSSSYFYRLTSADGRSNSTTTPVPPANPSQFTTRGPELEDTTVADFSAGTRSDTVVTSTGNGAVALGSSTAYDFAGATLPAGLTAGPVWTSGGTANVTDGALAVDGTLVRSNATFGPGSSIEFDATFGAAPFQHIGFGTDLDAQPWAFFSTKDTTDTLYARTKTTSGTIDTPLTPSEGSYIGGAHRYRIEWGTSEVRFFIDGALVQTHAATIGSPMQAVMSDYATGGAALSVDALTLSTRPSSGTFTSRSWTPERRPRGPSSPLRGPPPRARPSPSKRGRATASLRTAPGRPGPASAPAGDHQSIRSLHAVPGRTRTRDASADPTRSSPWRCRPTPVTVTDLSLFSVPAADTHQVIPLLDGVAGRPAVVQGETRGPLTVPVGTHRLSLTGVVIPTSRSTASSHPRSLRASDGTFTAAANASLSCVAAGPDSQGAVPLPTLSISDPQVVRPSIGHCAGRLHRAPERFRRSSPVTVNFATQDGTAKAGNRGLHREVGDPDLRSELVPPHRPSRCRSQPSGSARRERLLQPGVVRALTAATLADNVGTAQLINPNGPISVYAEDVDRIRSTTATTTADFTLSLSAAPAAGEQVTVQVNTTNGTASRAPTTRPFRPRR